MRERNKVGRYDGWVLTKSSSKTRAPRMQNIRSQAID
jgi:hypothetical protein